MATGTFVHDGNAIDYTPGADVAIGAVVVQGEMIGIAKTPIAANALGSLAIVGVFDLPKASGDGGIAAGAEVYWDEAEQVAKTDAEAGANKKLGKAIAAAEVEDEYGVRVGAEVMDFLILAADFSPTFGEPEAGDQITSDGTVFEVMSLAGQGQWRWSDPHRTVMRIHAKQVSSE